MADVADAFDDAAHAALRIAHDTIDRASREAQESVARVTHAALLTAYETIVAAASRARREAEVHGG